MAAAIPALKLHVSTMGSYGVVLFQCSKHPLLATGNVLAAGAVAAALAFFLRASNTPSTCHNVCSICKSYHIILAEGALDCVRLSRLPRGRCFGFCSSKQARCRQVLSFVLL